MSDVPELDEPKRSDFDAWNAAVAAIRAHCGWHVAPVTDTEARLDGTGSSTIVLPSLRVLNVVSVSVDGEDQDGYEWGTNGVLRLKSPARAGFGNVLVTFQHGFEKLPPQVLAVARSLKQAGSFGGVGQVTAGPFSMAAPVGIEGGGVGLNAAQVDVLAPFTLGGLP